MGPITEIQLRRDTAANWTASNPLLALGEIGIETDTRQNKLGDGVSVWSVLPYWMMSIATLAGATGAADVGYLPSGTGAVVTNVQAKLRQTVSVLDKGAVGDGSTNDTYAFQNAINEAGATGFSTVLECAPGKTYMCNTLTPKSNVTIDLHGSTIKLISGTNALLFDGTGTPGTTFQIQNGTLDMNMAGNQINYNMCAGGAWFVGWQFIRFKNMILQNAYRSALILNNCTDFDLDGLTFLNCGVNVNGQFCTCIEMVAGSSRGKVKNIYANNVWGFGLNVSGNTSTNSQMNVTTTTGSPNLTVNSYTGATPAIGNTVVIPGFVAGTTIASGTYPNFVLSTNSLYGVTGQTGVTRASITAGVYDIDIENVELNNFTQNGNAIGITYTAANRCSLKNFVTNGVDGVCVEINASSFVTAQNILANGCSKSALQLGDNGTGITNTNLVIDNFTSINGTYTYSIFLNMIQNSRFSNMILDKAWTTGGSSQYYGWNDRNNLITDTKVNTNAFNAATYYYKWALERVQFLDFYVEYLSGNTTRITNAPATPYGQFTQSNWSQVLNGGVLNINLNEWNTMGSTGQCSGKIMVNSLLQGNQSSYQEQTFVVSNTPNGNLGTLNACDNAGTARRITIAANGTTTNGPGLTLTNSTGVTLKVAWVCEIIGN
jgi:hypothetical protein